MEEQLLNRIPNVFDPNVLAIMGLMFQIFGAIFLSFESLGKEWLNKRFLDLSKFTKWYKKSSFRMSLIISLILSILFLGMFFHLKLLVAIFIPVLTLMSFFSLLIDHPDYYEKWVIRKASEGKLGPLGFIIVAIGAGLQMISLLIQM